MYTYIYLLTENSWKLMNSTHPWLIRIGFHPVLVKFDNIGMLQLGQIIEDLSYFLFLSL